MAYIANEEKLKMKGKVSKKRGACYLDRNFNRRLIEWSFHIRKIHVMPHTRFERVAQSKPTHTHARTQNTILKHTINEGWKRSSASKYFIFVESPKSAWHHHGNQITEK